MTHDNEHHGLDNENQIFFYEQDFYVLSNFSAFNIYWKSLKFDTSEQVYHWEKFPEHPALQARIRLAKSAQDAFKLAQESKHLQREDWYDVRVGIMKEILRKKAYQHEYVRRKLIQSYPRTLFENSHRDDFWGWGPNKDGQNMLGTLWMELRTEFMERDAKEADVIHPNRSGATFDSSDYALPE